MVKLNNGRIILLNGDCLQEMRRIKPASIDMVFADLPYGTTQNKWDSIIPFDPLWRLLRNIGKHTTPYVFTANGGFQFTLHTSQPNIFKYDWVWEKSKAVGHALVNCQPMRVHEHILVFYEKQCTYNPQKLPGKPYKSPYSRAGNNYEDQQTQVYNTGSIRYDNTTGDRFPRTVLQVKDAYYKDGHFHSTQKPVELLEYLIKTYTNPGDTVLDPTMGSGTTGVACANLNRRFIGIELEENYFNIAANRIAQAVKDHDQVAA